MGMRTDAEIEAWQKAAGIEPATGECARLLREMSDKAFKLIKVIELEASGIRDGDGGWHGSDVVGGTMRGLVGIIARYLDEKAFRVVDMTDDHHVRRGANDDDPTPFAGDDAPQF
ncbi:MAG TPA: hypothetical protein VKE72_09500 [Methylocella sp.]|nr:hypothetical protein [Methylocella sp.]